MGESVTVSRNVEETNYLRIAFNMIIDDAVVGVVAVACTQGTNICIRNTFSCKNIRHHVCVMRCFIYPSKYVFCLAWQTKF